jgi:hypothetical protein
VDELGLQLNDIVLFELPTFADSQAFRIHFRARWSGWSVEDEQVWLFAVELGDAAAELPLLLREAQDLLADRGLSAVPFVLDGRTYMLGASEPDHERADKKRQAA